MFLLAKSELRKTKVFCNFLKVFSKQLQKLIFECGTIDNQNNDV